MAEAARDRKPSADKQKPKKPMSAKRRAVIVWGLLLAAMAGHLLVCRWSTKSPGLEHVRLASLPNPMKYLAGQGAMQVHVSVSRGLGRAAGCLLGVVAPVLLVGVAGFVRLNATELKEITGAGVAMVLGFVIVGVLVWVSNYW